MNLRLLRLIAVLAALVLISSGCTSKDEKSLTVFAAASLKEPFEKFVKVFEDTHPGVKVTLQTGGSSTLSNQIAEGAPADVFASAGPGPMAQLLKAERVTRVADFASNQLILITPAGNPEGIKELRDLTRPSLQVVICQEQVPCGAVTASVLAQAGVALTPASLEKDVTAVLTKVRMGEADAGFVYVTDAKAAGAEVYQIDDPIFAQHRTTYPITVVKDSKHPSLAAEFQGLVLSEAGQSLLADHGFGGHE